MTGAEFDHHVLRYVMQHYYAESEKDKIGIYTVVGFRKMNEEFNEFLVKLENDTNPEPYQIFVARSHDYTTINIGNLVQEAKKITGIANGGGRDSVGGMNTNNKKKAIAALKFIIDYIRQNAP